MTDSSLQPPPFVPALTEGEGIDPREVLDYDAETGTYRASFESGRTTIGEVIPVVVAAVTRTDPLELPPTSPMLDTDAVQRLIDSSNTRSQGGDLHVSFTYADCRVTVHSYGLIAVRPLDEDSTD